jgi:capsular polysaccharide biosynthesis protein
MTQLEIVLALAFGVQFLASVSLAIKLQLHDKKIHILRDIINEIGMYLASQQLHQHQEEKEYAKSKSKTS